MNSSRDMVPDPSYTFTVSSASEVRSAVRFSSPTDLTGWPGRKGVRIDFEGHEMNGPLCDVLPQLRPAGMFVCVQERYPQLYPTHHPLHPRICQNPTHTLSSFINLFCNLSTSSRSTIFLLTIIVSPEIPSSLMSLHCFRFCIHPSPFSVYFLKKGTRKNQKRTRQEQARRERGVKHTIRLLDYVLQQLAVGAGPPSRIVQRCVICVRQNCDD